MQLPLLFLIKVKLYVMRELSRSRMSYPDRSLKLCIRDRMSYEGDDLITEEPDDEFLAIEARINGLGIKKVDNLVEYINFPINKCLMLRCV